MKAWHPARASLLVALVLLGPGMAAAQTTGDAVVQQLRDQGYTAFDVSQTLLGRVRIVAWLADGTQREIVLNPITGEILRDYQDGGSGVPVPVIMDRSNGGPSAGTPGAGNANDEGASGSSGDARSNGDNRNDRSGGNGSGSGNGNAGSNRTNSGGNDRGGRD